MKQVITTAIAGAAFLLAGMVHGETLYRGKVYQTTADRLIVERKLTCSYGPWSIETTADGVTVLSRKKVCK